MTIDTPFAAAYRQVVIGMPLSVGAPLFVAVSRATLPYSTNSGGAYARLTPTADG